MTKAQKAKWIKALRSGRYKQATGLLRSEAGYCCLGVFGSAVLEKTTDDLYGVCWPSIAGYDVSTYEVQTELAELNDLELDGEDSPVPFQVIAGVIDQWVETDD